MLLLRFPFLRSARALLGALTQPRSPSGQTRRRQLEVERLEDRLAPSISTTATLATDHPAGAVYGEPVNFTATVTASSGTPVGNVDFFDGSTDISGPLP